MEISRLRSVTCHNGITQYYLQSDTSEHSTHPALTPAIQARTQYTYPEGIKGWVDLGDLLYIGLPRWFTRPQTVTHPSTNRTECRLTSLIKPMPLTTTPRRHVMTFVRQWRQTTQETRNRWRNHVESWSGFFSLGHGVYTDTGKPEQQRFTLWRGVLSSISSSQRGAISGHPLAKRTDIIGYFITLCAV